MFELRNENEVWYKGENMPLWIHYGSLVVSELVEKEKYVIKKFDFEKGEYQIFTEYKTYLFNGTEYEVENGYFIVPEPKEDQPIYHPNDAELAIMEMQADMYEQQEQSNLTLMESLADLYETMTGGN